MSDKKAVDSTTPKIDESAEKVKKIIKMPHTLVIMISIIFLACVFTWVVPAGSYKRVENAQGVKVVVPTEFKWVAQKPVNPLVIPIHIVDGFTKSIDLLLLILFAGGAFNLVIMSGAIQSSVASVTRKYEKQQIFLIPVLTTLFALICTSQAVNRFAAFAPITVIIALALGFDSIVGVGIVLLGGAVGFSTGTLNIGTTILSQKMAELPLYSGIEYRAFSFLVFLVVTNIYLMRYAMKVKKTPTLSPMYDLDKEQLLKSDVSLDSFGAMDTRKWLVLLVLGVGLFFIAYGGIRLGWDTKENAVIFIWMSVATGLVSGMSPSATAKGFIAGVQKMVSTFLVIGSARAISSILTAGSNIDTIVYVLGNALVIVPYALQGVAMFFANIIVNVFITSGSGQAAAVMPIMIPLADMVGMTRQTAILAFNFGDGFCNYILPTSTALMGALGMANVPYDRWMRFMWKLFLVWVLVGSLLVMGAHFIKLGPF